MRILKRLGWVLGLVVLVVAVAFGLGYVSTAAKFDIPATVAEDPTFPRLEIGGEVLHGETFGNPDNPVVIALHGGPGGDYRSILSLRALSDRYFVVFYDQRGSGLSPRLPADKLRMSDFLAELDSIVEHYGKGRPVNLIGHSWGAMLATAYLSAHPDKVDHLVLAEPGILTPESAQAFMAATAPPKTLGFIEFVAQVKFESLHVHGPDDQARADYQMMRLSSVPVEGNPYIHTVCDGKVGHVDSWRYGALAQATLFGEAFDKEGHWRPDFVAGLDSYPRPVLFLTGACDTLMGADYQRKYHLPIFRNAELKIIEGAGHEMFADQPEATLAAIRTYLDQPTAAAE